MPLMMISEVEGQTPHGYDAMLSIVAEALKRSPGFLMHASHATENGWRIVEIWESRDHASRFFAEHVAPKLPPGIRPKLTFQPLHSLVQP